MPFLVHSYPLSWYVEKLERGEPFAYLSYGDGEWLVATGMRSGCTMQNGEVVTQRLEEETRASLGNPDPRIIRGTDPNLLYWRDYQGGDWKGYHELGRELDRLLEGRSLEFTDGVVFERACWEGRLGPLLEAFCRQPVHLVCNGRLYEGLRDTRALTGFWVGPTLMRNAVEHLDALEGLCLRAAGRVYVLCMGLGATALICRLLPWLPGATFIDLGSALDIFARIGEGRGWRADLYADEAKYQDLVRRNLGLEGVT